MVTTRVRQIWFIVVLFVISALPACAASVRIVRLSLVQGDVQIDRNAGDGWEQAIPNMPVIGGARIYAAENSKAELEFEDGSSVRLAGPAQITIAELSTSPKGSSVNVIQVDSGAVYVNARMRHQDDFRLTVSSGESFAIAQPSELRFTVDQQVASLSVMKGEALIQSGEVPSADQSGVQTATRSENGSLRIRAGQTYNYVLGQPASAARQDVVPAQPEDSWDQQRDSYNDQNAAAGAQYSGSDPNAPGVADLGAYGNYSDLPGYGVAWQPDDVGPDWNPYDNGAWSYYPDWGWTFVSGYPWGWTPFFYGDWCYVNGRGWWWRPGGGGRGRLPGGGGWHPQPRWAGHPGSNWNAPHAPAASVAHTTVAVPGSHLSVGPIAATHAANGTASSAGRSIASGNAFVSGNRSASIPAERTSGPTGRVAPASNLVHGSSGSPIVGRPGSYSLARGATTSHNGYEVHRPPSGYVPRVGSDYTAGRGYSSGYVPHTYSAPSASASAPHASTSAPSGGGGGSAPHGGAFSGGGGGGGGFHGGGGGGGGGHR
jgi:hypothetical protein